MHDDHFSQAAQDEAWFPEVGKRNWIVLTKDARIAKRLTERLAVANANIKMFVLTSQSLSGSEMANSFAAALPGLVKFIARNNAPFIAKVQKNGRVSSWKTEKDLLKELKYYADKF